VGAIVLGLGVGWTLISALFVGGNPWPSVVVMAAVGIGVIVGRGLGRRDPVLAPAVIAVVAASAALVSVTELAGPGGAPLGYGNANAAFFLQGTVAGVGLGLVAARPSLRLAGFAAGAVLLVVVAFTGSLAGILLAAVPLLGMLLPVGRGVRVGIAVAALVVAAAVVVTTAVAAVGAEGASADRPGRRERVRTGPRVSARAPRADASGVRVRRALWSDAYLLMAEHPVLGVGPGRFAGSARLADRDLGWAHNEFLQEGAEIGVPGYVGLLLAFLWGFARLGRGRADRAAAMGAASLTVLGVHASVDYVLHFPAIPVMAAILVGAAQVPARRDRPTSAAVLRKAASAWALPVGLLSPRRPGDVVILLYHRVGSGDRDIDVPLESFRAQLAELVERERVRTLDEALADGGGVVVTFDDGYRDFAEHAAPVLSEHRVPATLYLATGLVDGAGREGMSWTELRDITTDGLITVGSHTHGHVDLRSASEAEAEAEMARSKDLIEDRLGRPCRHFAYPWGVGSPAADRTARRLFDSAALRWGTNRAGRTDPYRLGRTPVFSTDGRILFRAKVRGRLDGEALAYRLLGRGPWRPG
jgi:peptidoglycan/xylan/chitin deacetylase (PgdA/CDA1 family)/O-antigen ligase